METFGSFLGIVVVILITLCAGIYFCFMLVSELYNFMSDLRLFVVDNEHFTYFIQLYLVAVFFIICCTTKVKK